MCPHICMNTVICEVTAKLQISLLLHRSKAEPRTSVNNKNISYKGGGV